VEGDENNEVYQKIIDAYHTPAVYREYKEHYPGITPVKDGVGIDLSQY
jgi:ABC-type metal ion transport system substrate-binding protein